MKSNSVSHSKSLSIPISGMHCRSCELLIGEKLSEVPGVESVEVSEKRGLATVSFSAAMPEMAILEKVIVDSGYAIGKDQTAPFFSKIGRDYFDLGIAAGALFGVFLLFQASGISEWGSFVSGKPKHLGVVFLVGLAAGVSTCLALLGGLVLGVAARFAESHPSASLWNKLRPHLVFHMGRLFFFVFLGGLLGAVGSFLSFSSGIFGVLLFASAAVMAFLGMKLVGVFPAMERFHFTIPPALSRVLGVRSGSGYSDRGAFLLGGISFFLPCGFTQAMQVFAASTGSIVFGASVMGVFAIGTMPGLFGIGAVAAFARGSFGRFFFRFSGLLVLALSVFIFVSAFRLFSLDGFERGNVDSGRVDSSSNMARDIDEALLPEISDDGFQIVRMAETSRGYQPSSLSVRKGVPVRWIIDARDPYSCAASLVVPKIGVERVLSPGENVIEFTPKSIGTIPFSCSMGMYTGKFIVVE